MPKCKSCSLKFSPVTFLQKFCRSNDQCREAETRFILDKIKAKKKKDWNKEKKAIKEKLMSHSDHVKLLQSVFNTYIRERDKLKLCICCDKPLTEKFHAGHYFAAGSNPGLRFNENNVHGQRTDCNLFLHGNLIGYTERLPKRIGQTAYEELIALKESPPVKYSIPQMKDLIKYYRIKTKQLKQQTP